MLKKLLILFLMTSSVAFADFKATYFPPQASSETPIATELRNGQMLEKIAQLLNLAVEIPRDVLLVGRSCGQANAFYSPQSKEITVCYELLAANANKLGQKLRNRASSQDIGRIWASQLIFVVLHEAGHAVVDLYHLPVLGRQEDAADQFAAYVLLSMNQEQLLKNALLFFEYNKLGVVAKMFKSRAIYSDEHSLSEQRLANIVCWGFGKSPEQFSDAAAAFHVSQHRLQRCANEFATMDRDIQSLLGAHLAKAKPQPSVAENNYTSLQPSYTPMNDQDAFNVLNAYRCLACHDLNARKIGPAFIDIARRYRGQNMEDVLIERVKRGSSGVWGAVPAPPIANASNYDMQELVRWIVSR